jgi:hypothetical protein
MHKVGDPYRYRQGVQFRSWICRSGIPSQSFESQEVMTRIGMLDLDSEWWPVSGHNRVCDKTWDNAYLTCEQNKIIGGEAKEQSGARRSSLWPLRLPSAMTRVGSDKADSLETGVLVSHS